MNLMNLKLIFLTKLNHLKIIFLILHQKNTGNQEHIITLLLDNITVLKDQMRQKDKVIDSLINQCSQQNNYLFQKRNTDNYLEIKLKSEKSKESVKSKETEKIKTTENNNNTEDNGETESEKNSETTNSHNKNCEQDISHQIEPLNRYIKQPRKYKKTMTMKEKKMLLYKTKRYLREKYYSKFYIETY